MANIAFIGLGNMGGPMAGNLVKAGHKVTAFDLVEASKNQAKSDGAVIADSAAAVVKGADRHHHAARGQARDVIRPTRPFDEQWRADHRLLDHRCRKRQAGVSRRQTRHGLRRRASVHGTGGAKERR